MAAGERYQNGKPKDIVKHAQSGLDPNVIVCGQKNYGYSTDDWSDVTCLKCLRRRRTAVKNILNKAIFN